MQEYNKYFSLENHIPENEFQCLMAEKRVWMTRCRMDRGEAHKAMPHLDIMEFEDEERTYGGKIVTSKPEDIQEAELIAKQRGFGEEVEGVLYGVIPYGHEMINPLKIKNSN